ncbi:MAG: hypothetical protein R3Y21_02420 [Mycoplasmatota bacterium]
MEKVKGSSYRCTQEELNAKINILSEIIEKMNSDCNEHEKAYQVFKTYPTPDKFRSAHSLIVKFGKDDPKVNKYIDQITEIYKTLLDYEQRGILADISYAIKFDNYLNNYKFAKFIITTYINSGFSYSKRRFFDEMGIDENIFEYCLKTLEELDLNLLEQYKEKKEKDKKQRYSANIYTFKNIAHGIKTGYLFSGKKFDLLEFWRLVPFKYSQGIKKEFDEYKIKNPAIYSSDNFYTRIKSFTEATIPNESEIILSYMEKHKIYNYKYISEEEFIRLYLGQTLVTNTKQGPSSNTNDNSPIEGKKFDLQDARAVINYINENRLPQLIEVYAIVQKRYIYGELTTTQESNKQQEKKKVLIP